MALRTFHSNPSIGGFGSESGGIVIDSSAHRLGGDDDDDNDNDNDNDDVLVPSLPGKAKRSQAGKTNHKSDFKSRESSSAKNHAAQTGRSCDAFAQIVKELVDNAVDACGGGHAQKGEHSIKDDGSATSEDNAGVEIKRVRVQIDAVLDWGRERFRTKKGRRDERKDEKHDGRELPTDEGTTTGDKDSEKDGTSKEEVLRVTVSDNGCGMERIEDCVAAFRTSKGQKRAGRGGGRNCTASAAEQAKEDEEKHKYNEEKEHKKQSHQEGERHTAGRYGIGLTLCLLHAQRLVPHSKASITSATASSTHWTRASYVVDAESDEVRCVDKEVRLKKRRNESGTAVSLLVPGGEAAQRAWPRLAEYLSRFQLSVHLKCSLEVNAPTLSSVPLFIRPPIEIERRAKILGKMRKETNDSQCSIASDDQCNYNDDDSRFWNDGMTHMEPVSDSEQANVEVKKGLGDQKDSLEHIRKGWISAKKTSTLKRTKENQELNDRRRQLILQGVSSYLKAPIDLKNVAHSLQPIRTRDVVENGPTSVEHGNISHNETESTGPILEVDVIVYKSEDMLADADEDDFEPEDEFEETFHSKRNTQQDGCAPTVTETTGCTAQLMLIRMVNRIPLLDSAEASACGIVQAMSNHVIWNSFGLDVSLKNSQGEYRDTANGARALLSSDIHIPTFTVKDSIQVAPFFQSNTHTLFEIDDGNESYESEDSDCEGGCRNLDDDRCTNEKRKRKKFNRLLPAGLRLGNVLVITQIHANPSFLPLPTLSKGRLPLNDLGINSALHIGLSSCLRSLQRSNPSLLLTSHQLKETERETRYIPAVSASLASIVCNSRNQRFQKLSLNKLMRWETRSIPDCKDEPKKDSPHPAPKRLTHSNTSERSSKSSISVSLGVACPSVTPCSSSPKQLITNAPLQVSKLGPIFEDAIRTSLAEYTKQKKGREKLRKKQKNGLDVANARESEGVRIMSQSEVKCDDYASIDFDELISCRKEQIEKRTIIGVSQEKRSRISAGSAHCVEKSSQDERSFSNHDGSFDVISNASKRRSLSSLSSESVRGTNIERFAPQNDVTKAKNALDNKANFDNEWW